MGAWGWNTSSNCKWDYEEFDSKGLWRVWYM